MKVLLAEYALFHDPSLAPEGRAMLNALGASFMRCGHEVVSPKGEDFSSEIARLAPGCDAGLVIAPDSLLAGYTRILEAHTRNIGSTSTVCGVCASKPLSGKILAQNGILVPAILEEGTGVIKEKNGCGALNMRLSEEAPSENEFKQEYIEGDHLSVSLIGTRIAGEVCLYYSGAPPVVLSVNRQDIRIVDGALCYCGGETPFQHPMQDEVVSTAIHAANVLGCQGYTGVDLVVSDRSYVVDVNPRPTSSLVGIAAIMKEEIAELILDASFGKAPEDGVHLSGKARYNKNGEVEVL